MPKPGNFKINPKKPKNKKQTKHVHKVNPSQIEILKNKYKQILMDIKKTYPNLTRTQSQKIKEIFKKDPNITSKKMQETIGILASKGAFK